MADFGGKYTHLHSLSYYGIECIGPKRFANRFKRTVLSGGISTDEDLKYKADKFYGGIGYGGDERPDLSNLQYALGALRKTSFDPKSDVWAKAQKLFRCQNRMSQ